jgi:hypothetical protein
MTFLHSPVYRKNHHHYSPRNGVGSNTAATTTTTDKLLPYKVGNSYCKKVITKSHDDIDRLQQIIPLLVDESKNTNRIQQQQYHRYGRRCILSDSLRNHNHVNSISLEESLRKEIGSGRISCVPSSLSSCYRFPASQFQTQFQQTLQQQQPQQQAQQAQQQLLQPLQSQQSLSNQTKIKKCVSFTTMANVHTIPTATDDDIYHSWYRDIEYQRFEYDRQRTIKVLHSSLYKGDIGSLEESGEYCMTGLEKNISKRTSLQRKYQTMQHNYAVLQQQLYNLKHGIQYGGDRSIQLISEQYSKPSAAQLAAHEYQQYLMLLDNNQGHPNQQQQQQQYHHHHLDRDDRYLTNVFDQALTI